MKRRLVPWPLVLGAFACIFEGRGVSAEESGKTARGLDVFVTLPTEVPSGGTVPLQLQVFGFPTATRSVALGSATIEAGWDPKSLGTANRPPPNVRATTDASGRTHLDVPLPRGDERELDLLVSARAENHERTRTFKVRRTRAMDLSIHVNDANVVSGGAASVWVALSDRSTGLPVPRGNVTFELLEGGTPRFTTRATTDRTGLASTRVPIPSTDDPALLWTLRANAMNPLGERTSAEIILVQRDESPSKAHLDVHWMKGAVKAGTKARFVASLRDASGEPVVRLPVRYWIGPGNTPPPAEASEWESVSTPLVTDLSGSIAADVDTPTLSGSRETQLTVVTKAMFNGHALSASAPLLVGAVNPDVTIVPELKHVVPGIEQRLLLQALDAEHRPIRGRFSVEGDGLRAEVSTDERGNGEFTWKPPRDVGVHRDIGPCAGGVAAALRVRAQGAALAARSEPFVLCVQVDRDARAAILPTTPFARAGSGMHFSFAGERRSAWSVYLQSENGTRVLSAWIDDGERGVDLTFPDSASGLWFVDARAPGRDRAAVHSAILVLPRVVPKLVAKVKGGRAAPSGTVTVVADLVDEAGRGLPGAIGAIMIDRAGGGNAYALSALDTRTMLTERLIGGPLGEGLDRDEFLLGSSAYDPVRRARLAEQYQASSEHFSDPAADAESTMKATLRQMMRSLEGALYEGSVSPERAREVRRRTARGFDFNPELLTLATDALDTPPVTPGGEPIALRDLVALDRQITFDNVARRVARLKLFRILSAVRSFISQNDLSRDEPLFADPNALLRRMVRDGALDDGALLDPWGGTIRFLPTAGPRLPFLSVHGFALRAPGPDGATGTADDVKDPFERVLKSGTPYADAVDEDRIVDAKWDMQVAEATVMSWEVLFQDLTGTVLGGGGRGEGIGLGSIGAVGHGSGGGGLADHSDSRKTHGRETGIAYWSAPVRTDARGHLELEVPLGAIETTWRLTLVGLPDGATPATTAVDIPVELPLSVQVESGARWVEGDQIDVGVVVRNRTAAPVQARLGAQAGGVAVLAPNAHEPKGRRDLTLEIPARGFARRTISVQATRAGDATLDVTAKAGALEDKVHHAWTVVPAGEPLDLTRTVWVRGESHLAVPRDAEGVTRAGGPELVLERGFEPALTAALSSLEPERHSSISALLDALEAATAIQRWALTRGGEADPLARRAAEVAERANGRFTAFATVPNPSVGYWLHAARATVLRTSSPPSFVCPLETAWLDERITGLQAEPPPGNAQSSCWNAFVGSSLQQLTASRDALLLARAAITFSEHAHRSVEAAVLAERLRELVPRTPTGMFVLPDPISADRGARATVLAALLRTIRLGTDNSAFIPDLVGWTLVQRDAQGGYGSSAATLAVVRALLATSTDAARAAKITLGPMVPGADAPTRTVDLGAGATTRVALDPRTTQVAIKTTEPGLLAQIRLPSVRSWKAPPPAHASPLSLTTLWPWPAVRHQAHVLKLIFSHRLGRDIVARARVPLPPGVTLAEETENVRQVGGVLSVTVRLNASAAPAIVDVPVRFTLSGRLTVPEATAQVTSEDAPPAYAPARPLMVRADTP